jgi:hypothetical protein
MSYSSMATQVEGILIHMTMRIMLMLMRSHMHTLWKTFLSACLFYVSLPYSPI